MSASQNLALFDFDGTITTKDTLPEIIKYIKGRSSYLSGLLRMAPVLFRYKAGFMSNSEAKELLLGHYFRGMNLLDFQKHCDEFGRTALPSLIRPKALAAIKKHQEQNDRIIVISASCENWIADWCKTLNLEYLGTRLQVHENILTGKLEGRNCYGQEKVNRLKESIDPATFSSIYAYGDSKGDRELLKLANHPSYRPFE